jgi:uncharacterized protein YwgA
MVQTIKGEITMNVQEKIDKYLGEQVVDPKITKIIKDKEGPVSGSVQTLLLLLSDVYDLPETSVVAQFKKAYPDADGSKVITFIKKIKKAALDLGI